ncbi:hypothetical protein GGR53DRAFT_242688 [Hypoxylon sp. FL1150]|nr:hypothetical protein GGR53DRAFT_242688 [Hypoxylon sp. FL1150]
MKTENTYIPPNLREGKEEKKSTTPPKNPQPVPARIRAPFQLTSYFLIYKPYLMSCFHILSIYPCRYVRYDTYVFPLASQPTYLSSHSSLQRIWGPVPGTDLTGHDGCACLPICSPSLSLSLPFGNPGPGPLVSTLRKQPNDQVLRDDFASMVLDKAIYEAIFSRLWLRKKEKIYPTNHPLVCLTLISHLSIFRSHTHSHPFSAR